MTNDIPCRCGHAGEEHKKYKYMVCNGCFLKLKHLDWENIIDLACRIYKQDNLSYLEQRYEETLK